MNEEKKVLRKGLTTGVHTCFAFWSVLDAFIVTKEFSFGKINKIDNDDLDVTKGCEIVVSISNIKDDLEFNELSLTPQRVEIGTNSLEIYAGIGVGVVTKKGLKIKEVQVEMKEREFGKSYLTPIKSMKYMVNMIFSIVFIRAITRKK